MDEQIRDLCEQIILDHSKHPRNYGDLADAIHVSASNPSCGDQVELHVKIGASGEVENVKFTATRLFSKGFVTSRFIRLKVTRP